MYIPIYDTKNTKKRPTLHTQNERTTPAIPPLELNPAAQNMRGSDAQRCARSQSLWFINAAGTTALTVMPIRGEGKENFGKSYRLMFVLQLASFIV